jgi:hypothetical protein
MDTEKFLSAYRASRNGCNSKFRHPLARQFVYSDGVKECAEAGCYWLLDIVGTEVVSAMRNHAAYFQGLAFLHVVVKEGKASLSLMQDEGESPKWGRRLDYTDMPDGKWVFYVADEGNVFMFLPSEY